MGALDFWECAAKRLLQLGRLHKSHRHTHAKSSFPSGQILSSSVSPRVCPPSEVLLVSIGAGSTMLVQTNLYSLYPIAVDLAPCLPVKTRKMQI